jgi:prepilin-type processing-associated H-X9-DG protein
VVALGGSFTGSIAHTSWAEGFAPYVGLTCVPSPNTVVQYVNPADGQPYDVAWVGGTIASYAALKARSYHANGVNALLMDGSVRFVNSSISQATWRALGTRSGGEVVCDF